MATPSTDPEPSEKDDDFAARMRAEEKEYSEGFDAAFRDFDWATVQPSQAELDWLNPRRANGSASSRGGAKKQARQNGPAEAVEKTAPKEFLSVKEAAEIVGLSEKAIRRAIDDGELPASKPRGRIRIKRTDLDAWIEASRVEPYSVPEIDPS